MLSFPCSNSFAGRRTYIGLEKWPTVARISELEQSYQSLSDEQLRAKTDEFSACLQGRPAKPSTRSSRKPFATVKVTPPAASWANPSRCCDHELTWDMVRISTSSSSATQSTRAASPKWPRASGKTLVSTLPLYLNFASTAGNTQPRRHRQRLPRPPRLGADGSPLHFLGVPWAASSSKCSPMSAVRCTIRDITYAGTASEFGFDATFCCGYAQGRP